MTFNSHLMNDVTTTRFRNERHKLRRHFESCLKLDLWHQMYWSLVPKQLLLSEPTVIFFFFSESSSSGHILFGGYLFLFIHQDRFAYMIINTTTHSFSDFIVSANFMFGKHWSTIPFSTSASYFPEWCKVQKIDEVKSMHQILQKNTIHIPDALVGLGIRE